MEALVVGHVNNTQPADASGRGRPEHKGLVVVHLEGRAGVAVGSGEPRVTEAALVQAVPVAPAVGLTRRAQVEVLHRPLHV